MVEYLIENIDFKNLIIYLIAINIIGFIAMGWDKWKAQRGDWRTPEKTLMMLCVLGGGIGTIAGIYAFRHKTKKLKFTIGMPTILILEICLAIYVYIKFIN